jgi:predicted nucleotidyltransferase
LENSSLCKICKKILVVGICKPCYEFNLAYNRDVVVENRKTIEDYAKEIQELKITNQEINKKNRELTENLQQCKKILVEKDAEIRKKEIELAKIDKENKEKLKKKQTESSALIFRLEEALKEVESLKEQLVNSKNDYKRYRNDCETLRHRLEERSKPDISRKKPLKLSYLKPVQTSSGCSSRDEISVFLQELDKWQEDVFPSYSEITNVIKSLIKTRFPSCTVEIYGSFATRLHLPSSDIDMVIKESECEKRETLRMIEKLLKDQPFIVSSIFINTAFIPVIKAKAELNGAHVQIDITVNDSNHAGLRCLELVSRLLDQSRLIRPVFLVLKHLFSVCDCKEPYTGGLGSYSLFLMVASFVQKRNDFEVKSDLFETLKGFFEFYLNQEVYFAPIVTKDPAGETHLKSENFFDFMRLVVVDPLNPLNNVSSSSDILKITEIFHVAAYNLKKSHFCDCITCSSPIYRMIYETGDYFRGKSR